jgi:GTP pyrophosphokinase
LRHDDCAKIKDILIEAVSNNGIKRDQFGLNPIISDMQTAIIVASEIGMSRASVLSIMLHDCVQNNTTSTEQIKNDFGEDVAGIVSGLIKINELYSKKPTIESENFRNLLLSFAEDMRVILILIGSRVNLMRQIRDTDNISAQKQVAQEAAYLYAPLAHKLGLYTLKSELEDLSLKYLEHDAYYMIKDKLNATKKARDQYISEFILPIEKKLKDAGLKFHMKGRTKSIHSIWQKMKKQKCAFEGVYDLFAIRIILDSPVEKEKQDCWLVYSIITDMYQPNPKRLRDWLSIPKSNGYESLHITVMGPQGKWVEVQIRSERMDEIAERGLAAHWRYKGIKGDNGIDEILTSIRTALETNADDRNLMDQFKMELYEDEVFVFTPKGDLYKLAKGATVLDFAYRIHTNVGSRCTSARINGKIVNMRHVLQSGDQVEIITSSTQTPKTEWLNIAATPHARTKIRQSLKETLIKQAEFGKEELQRKFKNRKLDYDETIMMRLIKKLGYKIGSEFYADIAENKRDVNSVLELYLSMLNPETGTTVTSADTYINNTNALPQGMGNDVLVIDQNMKGIDFTLARCCHPIYGDDIFGFVTVNGGIKVHRSDCPNATELRKRFGYRIVKAKWAGKGGSQYEITVRVIGNDDITIVNNITSIISKEEKVVLRNINISSNDGLFSGNVTIMVDDITKLEALLRKLRTIKGVKQVNRI